MDRALAACQKYGTGFVPICKRLDVVNAKLPVPCDSNRLQRVDVPRDFTESEQAFLEA